MYRGKKVSVVIPAFNEEKLIKKTVNGIPDFVDSVIVVDDSSKDRTYSVLLELKNQNKKLEIVRRVRNGGVGQAIIDGYFHAVKQGADVAVVIGGDAQMDPSEIPLLLDAIIDKNFDYVKGNRLFHKDLFKTMPKIRIFGNFSLSIITKFTTGYFNLWDPQCGFTAITSETIRKIDDSVLYKRYGFPNDLLHHLSEFKARVGEVEVTPIYNNGEKSGINFPSIIFTMSYVILRAFFRKVRKRVFFLLQGTKSS